MTFVPDIVIRNGTIVDGTGAEPFTADVAIAGGRILQVGTVAGTGREEIDASGLLVTPGFVDIHTHYDGQATWSQQLAPSSGHGVTTVVVGNCGVGFAPCRPADRDALVNVMEGVEDIPEAVMAEGLPWNWETFPQYLDALGARSWDADVAVYIPHSPLRVYVMGERGLRREPATDDDLARMQELVSEGMAAGALGFATSRTLVHRTGDGDFIPSFNAHRAELEAIAQAVARSGRGVIQMVPNLGSPHYREELDLLVGLAEISGRPVTFSLAQSHEDRRVWREALDRVAETNGRLGKLLAPQVFPRPMGVITGLETSVNPFSLCASYAPLQAMPLAARVEAMQDPAVRERLLTETPADPANPLFRLLRNFEHMYPLDGAPSYEPPAERSVAAMAEARGISAEALIYDLLLENEGRALLYLPFSNYADHNLDAVLEMMRDPNSVIGLGDGGAHYGLICDGSYPTTLLAHWTRDREGERLPLAWAVKALSADTADLVGLTDRGRIAPRQKADLNIIDHEGLRLHAPRVTNDLPGGGRRLMQDADGYRATIVGGEVTQRDGRPTGALPGRLVRGGAHLSQ